MAQNVKRLQAALQQLHPYVDLTGRSKSYLHIEMGVRFGVGVGRGQTTHRCCLSKVISYFNSKRGQFRRDDNDQGLSQIQEGIC